MQIAEGLQSNQLKIEGALDLSAADALRKTLAEVLNREASLELDLSGVEECDTAAIQLLISAGRTAQHSCRRFLITALSPAVTETAAALGVPVEELTAAGGGDVAV